MHSLLLATSDMLNSFLWLWRLIFTFWRPRLRSNVSVTDDLTGTYTTLMPVRGITSGNVGLALAKVAILAENCDWKRWSEEVLVYLVLRFWDCLMFACENTARAMVVWIFWRICIGKFWTGSPDLMTHSHAKSVKHIKGKRCSCSAATQDILNTWQEGVVCDMCFSLHLMFACMHIFSHWPCCQNEDISGLRAFVPWSWESLPWCMVCPHVIWNSQLPQNYAKLMLIHVSYNLSVHMCVLSVSAQVTLVGIFRLCFNWRPQNPQSSGLPDILFSSMLTAWTAVLISLVWQWSAVGYFSPSVYILYSKHTYWQ